MLLLKTPSVYIRIRMRRGRGKLSGESAAERKFKPRHKIHLDKSGEE
jgi:hypothetical protein